MGAEAPCQLRLDGRSQDGKALLETDELRFRGDALATERGIRLMFPFAAIRAVSGDGGVLRVRYSVRDALRDTDIFFGAKRVGLTYTRVARFSATHTAEKLVIPKRKR